jgi:hypothetical protein
MTGIIRRTENMIIDSRNGIEPGPARKSCQKSWNRRRRKAKVGGYAADTRAVRGG